MAEAQTERTGDDGGAGERGAVRRKAARRVLLTILASPFAAVMLAVLLIQLDSVSSPVVNRLAARFDPWTDATLSVDRADVRGLRNIVLYDARLTRNDGVVMATVDTLALELRPLALLRRSLVIPGARVAGADVTLRQRADSTWDLLAPFMTGDTAAGDGGMRIRVDDAAIVRSRVEARFLAAADSILRVEGIEVRLANLRMPDPLTVRLDTLGARIHPPSRPASPAQLSAKLMLENGVLTANTVQLHSDSSNVSALGTLLLPGGDVQEVSDIEFRVAAHPLDFRDIGAFVPGFDVAGSLRFDARVHGSANLIAFEAVGRSFDGATFDATGELTPRTRNTVRYVLDAELRGLDPQLWSAGAPAVQGIDADAAIALAGPSLDSIDGNVELRVGRTQLREFVILPTKLDATFETGRARFALDAAVSPWAGLVAEGTVRPFDDEPEFSIDATVRQLGDTTLGGVRIANGRARIRASGSGVGAATASGDATVDIDADVGRAEIRGARIVANWAGSHANAAVDANVGDAAIDATLRLDRGLLVARANAIGSAGRLSIDARARPYDDVPTWSIERLIISALDIGRAREGLPASDIDAALSVEGRGTSPVAMRADGTLTITSSRIAGETIDTAAMMFQLREGSLDVRGDARALNGSAMFAAIVRPFDDTITFRVDPLRFEDIVLDSTAVGLATVLAGVLVAEGALPPDTFPRLTGTLEIEPTRINSGQITGGHVAFDLQDAAARVDANVSTAEGSIDVRGATRLVRTESGAMRMAGAHAIGRVRLPDIEALLGRDSADADFDARFAVDSDGTDPETMAWAVNVTATGSYATARLDTLRVDARVGHGIIRIDTLLLHSNVATGGGAGVLAISSDATLPDSARLHVRLDADSAFAIDELLGMQQLSLRGGALTVDATNADGGIDAEATLVLRGLISTSAWADSMRAGGTARLENGRLAGAKAEFSGTDIGIATIELEALRGTVEYDTTEVAFNVTIDGDDSHSAGIAGTAIPRERAITFTNMDIVMNGRSWALLEPASVVWAPRITIDDLSLRSGARGIAVAGVIDRAGTQDLTVTLDSVPVEGFGEFAGFDGIDGMLDGGFRVTGPAGRVAIDASLNVRLLGMMGTIVLDSREDARLAIDARLADESANPLVIDGSVPFALSLAPGDTSPFAAEGELALGVVADSFSLAWLTPLLRPRGIERFDGALDAAIRIAGTMDDPGLSGTASIRRGRLDYPRHGVVYRDLRGEFEMDGDRVRVRSLHTVAEGSVTIDGDIVFETAGRPGFDLRVRFDGFRAVRNEWVRLGLSGNATITGDGKAPRLEGAIRLVDSDIFADRIGQVGGGPPVELVEEDYRMLASYFGYRPSQIERQRGSLIDPWDIDVAVTVGPDVWLRRRTQPEMRIQVEGAIDVRKEPGDSIRLFGTVEALPQRSYFEQFGRRFDVITGTVTFNSSMMGWRADFEALYRVPSFQDPSASEVGITLDVTGGMHDLELILGAEPDMEMSDILSYLATGRPAASAAAFGAGGEGNEGIAGIGVSFAAGQLAAVLEEKAAEAVGLDVVEIRQNGLKGATLVAGRYVTPRLFVGFEQPLTLQGEEENKSRTAKQSTEVELEYAAYRWLLVSLQGGQSSFRFFFRTRYAF